MFTASVAQEFKMGHSKGRTLTPLVRLKAGGDARLGVRITKETLTHMSGAQCGCWRGPARIVSYSIYAHVYRVLVA